METNFYYKTALNEFLKETMSLRAERLLLFCCKHVTTKIFVIISNPKTRFTNEMYNLY